VYIFVTVIILRLLIPVQTMVETHGPGVLHTFDDQGHTAAHYASLGGHSMILRFIIESRGAYDEPSRDDIGQRPIHWACINGHISIVDILLQVISFCFKSIFTSYETASLLHGMR
jgi:palmitoyltransferase ZDHHC13/17